MRNHQFLENRQLMNKLSIDEMVGKDSAHHPITYQDDIFSSKNFSASNAAMHPNPAEVTA